MSNRKKCAYNKLYLLWIIVVMAISMIGLQGCGAVKVAGITNLKVNYRINPMGIDNSIPVFSWQMSSDQNDKSQSAYRIIVWEHGTEDEEITNKSREISNYVWDSGKVESDLSVSIPYEGEELKPQTRYDWTVEVWDEDDKLCSTSGETAYFETGLMGEFPEEAHWISAPNISASTV